MKKILFIAISFLISLSVFAQTMNDNSKFKVLNGDTLWVAKASEISAFANKNNWTLGGNSSSSNIGTSNVLGSTDTPLLLAAEGQYTTEYRANNVIIHFVDTNDNTIDTDCSNIEIWGNNNAIASNNKYIYIKGNNNVINSDNIHIDINGNQNNDIKNSSYLNICGDNNFKIFNVTNGLIFGNLNSMNKCRNCQIVNSENQFLSQDNYVLQGVFKKGNAGDIAINGNYGTAGQVLMSNGQGAATSWETPITTAATPSNLNYTATATEGSISNSNGTGFTVPAATTTNAGLFTPTEKTKLSNIVFPAATAWIPGGNGVGGLQSLGTTSNFDLPFITNNTEKMRILSNGNIGIGTVAPVTKLQVNGTSWFQGNTKFTDPSNSYGMNIDFGIENNIYTTSFGQKLSLGISSQKVLTITESNFGSVGIGTITPTSKLEVTSGTAGISGIKTTDVTSATTTATTASKFWTPDANGNMILSNVILESTRQDITSGITATINNKTDRIYFNPPTAIPFFTLTLPAVPLDGEKCTIYFGGTVNVNNNVVTNLTILPNTGQTTLQASVAFGRVSGDIVVYSYDLTNTRWYRER